MGDELIEILNGIVREERRRGRSRPEVYYNEFGEATDDFLEAVKSESKPRSLGNASLDEEDEESFARAQREWRHEVRAKPSHRVKSRSRHVRQSTLEDLHPSHRTQRREKRSNKPTSAHGEPNYLQPVRAATTDRVYSSSSTDKGMNPLLTSHTGGEGDSSGLEGKIATLRLRVQGQQSTVRALEAKVSELTAMLELKDKEIASLSKRTRTIDAKEPSKAQSTVRSLDLRKYEEALDKLRTEKKLLMGRVIEEQNKVKRAEDRTREMKEYADKAKLVSHQIEVRTQDQATFIEEMKTKLAKYRRESKEFNAKYALIMARAQEKENELKILAEKYDTLEKKVKEVASLFLIFSLLLTFGFSSPLKGTGIVL